MSSGLVGGQENWQENHRSKTVNYDFFPIKAGFSHVFTKMRWAFPPKGLWGQQLLCLHILP